MAKKVAKKKAVKKKAVKKKPVKKAPSKKVQKKKSPPATVLVKKVGQRMVPITSSSKNSSSPEPELLPMLPPGSNPNVTTSAVTSTPSLASNEDLTPVKAAPAPATVPVVAEEVPPKVAPVSTPTPANQEKPVVIPKRLKEESLPVQEVPVIPAEPKPNPQDLATIVPPVRHNRKVKIIMIVGILVMVLAVGVYYAMSSYVANGVSNSPIDSNTISDSNPQDIMPGQKVKFETNQGDIVIQTYEDTPVTSGNFLGLVKSGVYDGVIFHRVIPNFVIQGGDPTGTGFGDPSIPKIKDEFTPGRSNTRGTLSMANSGPNTGSSQFFINLVDNIGLDYDQTPLSSKHPVFGEVIEGLDVIDKIAGVTTGSNDKPLEDVVIVKATII